MKKIPALTKKTGFEIVDENKPVVIRDERGLLFYNTEPYTPRIKYFNLPAGFTLFLEVGNIRSLKAPIKQPYQKMPVRQRFRENPENFALDFGDNPNKCSIIWPSKLIFFDKSYLEKPIPFCYFTLFHEFGHQFYKTEEYADMYSRNKMLKMGFNQSQVGEAIIDLLSPAGFDRKESIVNSLI